MPWRRTIAVLFVITGACAVPVPTARSAADYAKKAGHTADEVHSAVEATILALDAAGRGHALPTTLNVVVSNAEDDARGAASTFERVEPRAAADSRVRQELVPLLNAAVDGLVQARRLAREGRMAEADVAPVTARLAGLAKALDDFTNARP